MPDTDSGAPLTPGAVARLFGVSVVTVATWADSGKLPHFRTPGGQRRFRPEDVEAFIDAQTPREATA